MRTQTKKLKPLGDLLIQLEPLLDKLVIDHALQKGDVLALISMHLDVHNPDCKEIYLDDTNPIFYYGPKKGLK